MVKPMCAFVSLYYTPFLFHLPVYVSLSSISLQPFASALLLSSTFGVCCLGGLVDDAKIGIFFETLARNQIFFESFNLIRYFVMIH